MIIRISSYGIGSVYNVDFDRTDVVSLDEFLASKDVFPSDRQVNLFVTNGECVEFTRSRGKTVVKSVVTDITEEENKMEWRRKAREIVNRWNESKNTTRLINMLNKFSISQDPERARRVVALNEKWNRKVSLIENQIK